MSEVELDFIIRAGTFDGKCAYESFDQMEKDYKAINRCNVNPLELLRCVAIAYELGKFEGKSEGLETDTNVSSNGN